MLYKNIYIQVKTLVRCHSDTNRVQWIPLDSTRVHRIPLESTRVHWIPTESTGFQQSPPESTGFHWTHFVYRRTQYVTRCDIYVTNCDLSGVHQSPVSPTDSGGVCQDRWGTVKYCPPAATNSEGYNQGNCTGMTAILYMPILY